MRFIDIANCFNVHAFILWEMCKRYGFHPVKDKYGRGHLEDAEATILVSMLPSYPALQRFTYKQEINKGQYVFRDEARRDREAESERDVPREYSVTEGRIVRTTSLRDGTVYVCKWNNLECYWER